MVKIVYFPPARQYSTHPIVIQHVQVNVQVVSSWDVIPRSAASAVFEKRDGWSGGFKEERIHRSTLFSQDISLYLVPFFQVSQNMFHAIFIVLILA